MQSVWSRIEVWLGEHLPEMAEDLMPGASEQEIQLAEESMTVGFPDSVKESYRIHDGQSELANPLVGEWQLFSLKGMVRDWEQMKQLFDDGKFDTDAHISVRGPVRAEWWNPKWIGIATNGAGDLYCLDFDPGPGGHVGQIITFWHMVPERKVIATSFRDWLEKFADDLEAGKFVVEDDGLVRVLE